MGTSTTSDARASATVERFVEDVLDGGDLSILDELVASDVVQHGPGTDAKLFGADRVAEYIADLRGGFPNLSVKRTNLVVSDDIVVDLLTFTGTHAGRYMGIPPTGDTIIVSGVNGFRLEDGQIAEMWVSLDRMGILQQVQALSTAEFTTEQHEFPANDLPEDWRPT